MKPFRKNVALAVDGGGIKGVIVSRAIAILEEYLQRPAYEVFRLLAGTSTGSIVSAGISTGLFGEELHTLYCDLGPKIFKKTWRSTLWPLTRYRYPLEPLQEALEEYLGEKLMGDFWYSQQPTDLVITAFDLVENKTLFIKPFNQSKGYDQWPVVKAVLASSSVPSYFPPVEDRYVDGGVGSYHNPCYVAAYEAQFVLDWDPAETTLISLGTGREPHSLNPSQIKRFWPWHWISPVLGAFRQSSDDQQVHLVETFFNQLDFRRFQVDLNGSYPMDKPEKIPELTAYGDQLGEMIINDQMDQAMQIQPNKAYIPDL
ncbi:MAG: patatin-like phospholipase family protein [Anaerolineales bacterium]|nr:patatin-like phospholipase family protein [Anaerolineales bacterium]